LRLMFWTPSPMLETSSEPSLRRPIAEGASDLLEARGRAGACLTMPPTSEAVARLPAESRNERRPISLLITAPGVCVGIGCR
jgi:hypothetical protein